MASLRGLSIYIWPFIISFSLLFAEAGRRFLFFICLLLVLAAQFAVAPIGVSKIIFTLLHLIGDPIDSLWSVLIRKEVAGRSYNLALQIAPEAAKDVATVLTAYDQWWQDDAAQLFRENLQLRTRKWKFSLDEDGEILDVTKDDTSVNGDKLTLGRVRTASRTGWLAAWWASCPSVFKKTPTPRTGTSNLEAQSNLPPNREVRGHLRMDEIERIKRASRLLAANRSDTLFGTWNAIVIFLVILTGVCFITALEYGGNQTPYALAVVLQLFSFLTFAVYVSGHVGNFNDHSEVITVIHGLQEYVRLFPELNVDGLCVRDAPLAAINSWRPYKDLQTYDSTHDRSRWTLLAICCWAILSSWASAFRLSFLTLGKGTGCPPRACALIGLSWILSFLIDQVLRKLISSRRSGRELWYTTLVKDAFFALGSTGLVVAAEIGFMNTLWCRANNVIPCLAEKMSIDLRPVTREMQREFWIQWLIIPIGGLAIILLGVSFLAYGREDSHLLFVRTSEEMNADKTTIQNDKSLLSASSGDDQTSDSELDHPRRATTRRPTQPRTRTSPKARAKRVESASSSEDCAPQQRLKEYRSQKAAKTRSTSRKLTVKCRGYKTKSELRELVRLEYKTEGSGDGGEVAPNTILPSSSTVTVPESASRRG